MAIAYVLGKFAEHSSSFSYIEVPEASSRNPQASLL
jgi:hypothetical protein